MARGGRPKDRDAPERRCVVTGERGGTFGLIRFVLDPDGEIAPDLAEKLPGRGYWLTADRAVVDRAVRKKAFARATRGAGRAPEDLTERLETLLRDRVIAAISLCRKAGLAIGGFEKVRAALPHAAVLVQASDVSETSSKKMRGLADGLPVITALDSSELGAAFGRSFLMHAVLTAGGATDRAWREAVRLQGVRFGDAKGP